MSDTAMLWSKVRAVLGSAKLSIYCAHALVNFSGEFVHFAIIVTYYLPLNDPLLPWRSFKHLLGMIKCIFKVSITLQLDASARY